MKTNQLPPLPTPKFTETIRGVPCITVTEHEHLMRAYALQARAILALRPERVRMTGRELELIDGMIAVQLDHAQRCDAISNRAMAEKQKGWDMERVELLRRIRSFGITTQEGTNGEIN